MIFTIDYSLPHALYRAKFSAIGTAASKAALSVVEATLTCLHELAILTFESVQERLEWVEGVIAESHYAELPPLQEWDECGLVLAGCAAVVGPERDWVDAVWSERFLLPVTMPLALLTAGKAKTKARAAKGSGRKAKKV